MSVHNLLMTVSRNQLRLRTTVPESTWILSGHAAQLVSDANSARCLVPAIFVDTPSRLQTQRHMHHRWDGCGQAIGIHREPCSLSQPSEAANTVSKSHTTQTHKLCMTGAFGWSLLHLCIHFRRDPPSGHGSAQYIIRDDSIKTIHDPMSLTNQKNAFGKSPNQWETALMLRSTTGQCRPHKCAHTRDGWLNTRLNTCVCTGERDHSEPHQWETALMPTATFADRLTPLLRPGSRTCICPHTHAHHETCRARASQPDQLMGVCDGRSTSPDFRTFSRVQGPATALVVTDTDTGARSRYQRSAAFAGMSVSVPTVQRALPDWARSFELPQGIHDAGLPEWAHSAVDQIRRPVVSHRARPQGCGGVGRFGVCKLVASHHTRFGFGSNRGGSDSRVVGCGV